MQNEKNDYSAEEFSKRTKAALGWLIRSFDVNRDGGSSAYYAQFYKPFGWAKSYPETTGYIIPTLIEYHQYFPHLNLKSRAACAADWICTLPLKNGALPAGLTGAKEPSIFNTGQMMIGLIKMYEWDNDQKYYKTFSDAAYWLVQIIKEGNSWTGSSYVTSYEPSYYTRVIWPMLWANKYIEDDEIVEKARAMLSFYKGRTTDKKSIEDWSFQKNQRAFTHTIAYTLRGFYESALLLNDNELQEFTLSICEKVMKLRERKGKLAGWYDEAWNGSYWFSCLSGNCQISILFNRIYEETGDVRYLNTALKLFDDVLPHQNMSNNRNKRGALPGSAPFFGRYLALRYPNWATKFFLDAYLRLHKNIKKLEEAV